jgi:sialate O-acetylesterase
MKRETSPDLLCLVYHSRYLRAYFHIKKNKMKKSAFTFLTLFVVMALGFQAIAEVKLPAIFGDNMVLQQQSRVAVWGHAKARASVRVTCSWNNKSYTATADAQGYWKVAVQTPAASYTPYRVVISDGKAVTLENVLVGEVWLCSGQSNMEMAMRGYPGQPVAGGPEAIARSRDAALRCFTVKRATSTAPLEECEGTWELAGPGTTPGFTATGYYFARLLRQSLDVPVGLIHSSWGGSRIEAWMPAAAVSDIPGKSLPAPDANVKNQIGIPTVLYNGMLHPVVGYGMRGAIWYQGEANRLEPELYVTMFDKMVRGWRNAWGAGEFPVYYCQIAPYNYEGDVPHSGHIREAQAKGMLTTPNTGMAVLMDARSPNCIHPPKKNEAGERLALWALAETYGMTGMHYRSPEYKSMEVDGRVAIVAFEMFGSTVGLTTHGKELRNFKVAGDNKRFYNAAAVLSGDKVYLFSPSVPRPVAVRYCFDSTSETELFSMEGDLPVSSFRTDAW